MEAIMLCVFDVNETLLDLAGLDPLFADLIGDAADVTEVRAEWFDLMIHNALVVTATGGYRPFGEIAAACLTQIATNHGTVATDEHRRELGVLMRRLPAHPEVGEAIEQLRSAGFSAVALTNSVLTVAEDQLTNAGLRPLFDAVHSADHVRRLKPAPEPYRHVVDTHHIAPEDAALIAAHDWDIAGAAAAGLTTAFVARHNRTPLAASNPPTVTGPDLTEVTARLIERYTSR
jgi:2-haloacid dehalogenase